MKEKYDSRNERWSVKPIGKTKKLGIASTKSDWFVCEDVSEGHGALICEMFNERQKKLDEAKS